MINEYLDVVTATTAAIDTAGDMLVFTPAVPVDIVSFGVTLTTTTSVAVTVLTLDKRPTAGSDTARTAAQSTITIPIAAAAGKQYRANFQPIEINPGEEVVIQTDGGSTAGDGFCFISYRRRPLQARSSETASKRDANVTVLTA